MNNEENCDVEMEVSHLKKYYKAGWHSVLKAVDDVSFRIYKGETLGLVGESGCGKTTCGKTCIGMLEKTDGQVLYQGKDVHSMSKKEHFAFTKKVQMIFQDPYASLNPHEKVYDIIAEGFRFINLRKIGKKKERWYMNSWRWLDLMRNMRPEMCMNFPEDRDKESVLQEHFP